MHKLNLIPKELILERNKRRTRILYLCISIIVIFIVVVGLKLIEREAKLADSAISAIESEVSRYRFLNEGRDYNDEIYEDNEMRRKIYEQVKENRIHWAKLIERIFHETPEDIAITSLNLDRGGGIVIEGSSQKNFQISRMMTALEGIDETCGVFLGFSRQEKSKEVAKSKYIFQITAMLKGD